MDKNKPLPAIIAMMVEKLMDKSTPPHIKANYFVTLENIRDACNVAIENYNMSEKKRA